MINVKIKLWAKRIYFEHVSCKLCMCELNYSELGFQAMAQHFAKERHKSVSKDRLLNDARHITDDLIQAVAVSDQFPTTSQKIVYYNQHSQKSCSC